MAGKCDVLIVGAGPTGLALALWLTRLGVTIRIVDKAAEPGATSRAIAVHARTLELYDQLGLAADIVAHSRKIEAVRLWVKGRQRARLAFGDMGVGLSPFPYVLVHPQDEHEELLVERLGELGVEVERGVELMAAEPDGEGVVAHLTTAGGRMEHLRARWLAGCDGAHSKVRDYVTDAFPGGTYSRLFYVADIEGAGPVMNAELNLALDDADFLAVFPMRGTGRARLVGDIERPDNDELTFADVGQRVFERLGLKVNRVNWFSTYRVHHRVAMNWRAGPLFLLGDAAHVHSPVGGQGMNTGLGDAANLAWKLAAVIKGQADAALLDTYEAERIAFARRLIASTDRAFQLVSRDDRWARFARLTLAPMVLPWVFGDARRRRQMFLTVSQTSVSYRGGALAEGGGNGAVRAGDRLPWVREADNFAPLRRLGWHAQTFGEADTELEAACCKAGVKLVRYPWTPASADAGFERNALYLVRPDGYIGLTAAHAEAGGALAAYRSTRGLAFNEQPLRQERDFMPAR